MKASDTQDIDTHPQWTRDEHLLVLATAGARHAHMLATQPSRGVDPGGHVGPFETCPHADCLVVRTPYCG